MVNLSKEIHSPKHSEKNLINYQLNVRTYKKKNKNNINENFGLFPKNFHLKNFQLFNNDIKNINTEENKKNNDINHLKKFKWKRIKPNCYYNKLHLNKIKNIIDKYTFHQIE